VSAFSDVATSFGTAPSSNAPEPLAGT